VIRKTTIWARRSIIGHDFSLPDAAAAGLTRENRAIIISYGNEGYGRHFNSPAAAANNNYFLHGFSLPEKTV
jgi:hypothetical protein